MRVLLVVDGLGAECGKIEKDKTIANVLGDQFNISSLT
jgi:hypothetical protein